jgi:hypothetical protein
VNQQVEPHLSDEEIVWASVDSSRLGAARKQHLLTCRRCRAQRDHLGKMLETAGQMAADGVPLPTRIPPFEDQRIQRSGSVRIGWRKALVGAALVLAVSFTIGRYLPIKQRSSIPGSPVAPVTDYKDPQTWMIEVNELSENALPQVFLDIAGQIEPGINDEFIEFIVPTEENDNSLGEMSLSKGVA